MFDGLVELQPGIIVNNNLLYGHDGDLRTPEQNVPPTGLNYDWEACMTMNTTWGYKSYDDWKSSEQLIRNLVDSASKGAITSECWTDGQWRDSQVHRASERCR